MLHKTDYVLYLLSKIHFDIIYNPIFTFYHLNIFVLDLKEEENKY